MYVCLCYALTENQTKELLSEIDPNKERSLEDLVSELKKNVKVSSGCGLCRDEVIQIIKEYLEIDKI